MNHRTEGLVVILKDELNKLMFDTTETLTHTTGRKVFSVLH